MEPWVFLYKPMLFQLIYCLISRILFHQIFVPGGSPSLPHLLPPNIESNFKTLKSGLCAGEWDAMILKTQIKPQTHFSPTVSHKTNTKSQQTLVYQAAATEWQRSHECTIYKYGIKTSPTGPTLDFTPTSPFIALDVCMGRGFA